MKNIIFDLGSVILKGHAYDTLNKLNLSNEEYNKLLLFFKNSEIADLRYESLSQIFDKCNFDKELYKYKDSVIKYYEIRDLNQNLIALIKKLKQNYKIYILSDNNKEAIEYYKKKFNFLDGMVASCDYHVSKNEGKLLEILINKYNLNPSECYFIDDKKENISLGEKIGIKGFVFNENQDIALLYEDMKENNIKI